MVNFIYLGIFYILLFLLFPDTSSIRIIIFIIVALFVVYFMYNKFALKVITHNLKFLEACKELISSDINKKIEKNLKSKSKILLADLELGFNPIIKIFHGSI